MNLSNRLGGDVLESNSSNTHPLISWRSVVAGLLISFFTMAGLLGLGMAFGGISMNEDTSASSAGIFTGIWFLVSALLSLFVGSYFAARVSKFQTGRIGSAHGLVIAALFLGFFFYQTVSAIGSIGSAAGSLLGKTANLAGRGVEQASQSNAITTAVGNMAEDALGDLNLRSDPKVVATGVANRLMSGNVEGAKNYLALQAGISPAEADAKIAQLKIQADKAVGDAKMAAADAMKATGWSLFLMVVLGALAAVGGGGLGSVANFRNPLSREQYQTMHSPA